MFKSLVIAAAAASIVGSGLYAGGSACCVIPQRAAAAAAAKSPTRVATLHIEGMTCGACATAVKHVLSKVDGVRNAEVSFEEKKGVVSYDAAKVSPEQIARAIQEKLPTYKATVVK